MALFVCDACGCLDNTARGHFWDRNSAKSYAPEYVGKALCCECGPPTFIDGKPTGYGTWTGRKPKQLATAANAPHVRNPEAIREPTDA